MPFYKAVGKVLTVNEIQNKDFNDKSTMINTLRTLYILIAFALLPAFAAAQGTRYFVTLEADGTLDGLSWDKATTLAAALTKAGANDEIWLKGYAEPDAYEKIYYVSDKSGYTLKSGVRLYGGFKGDETSTDQREVVDGKAYRMQYRTVISGDKDRDDARDATSLIFPGNDTRDDNAVHVLTLEMKPDGTNVNNWATVVDGVTIAGGHAEAGKGGGIYITGDNDNGNNNGGRYILRRCFFIGNYAAEGGALYVESTVKNVGGTCLIDRCGFFNNAAGTRGTVANAGGAVYLAGAGTIVNSAIFNNENGGVRITGGNDDAAVVNSTVTRNTGSGIDGAGVTVNNTVIWGNSLLSTSDDVRPAFNHCSYPEANADGQPDSEGNIYLDTRNNEKQGPHFDSPSLKTGFDTDYDVLLQLYPLWTWVPLEGSNLIDKGDDGKYLSSYGDTDLDGNSRTRGDKIDIGAFEFQPVSAPRIRYVKQDGTGDGTSWDNASGDLQAMIDQLAESGNGQPGEVWVAAGEYEPLAQLMPGTGYSASFRMRDGISVYGGFVGDDETSKTERDERRKKVNDDGGNAMPWQFFDDKGDPIETILSAAYYGEDNIKFDNNKWTTTSDSRHVVWFAPLDGDEAFARPTYLDGVTIRGGYAQGGTGLDEFKTDRGAGVYMDGENTYLVNSTVTECYATGNGGGVYLRGGRVQTSLIYNNNADQGGGAVYVDDQGLVHRSMLANNSARNGAGVYLDNADGDNPEYLILSTCVVSNNTSTGNAAVYCNLGGVLLQNTVVNNRCVTATDLTDPNASQTGGLYLNEYGLVANSVIWNNRMGSSDVNIPMYAKNPTASKVRFMYNAISGINNAVWNNTLQEQTLALVDANQGEADNPNSIGPRFEEPTGDNFTATGNGYIDNAYGVQEEWRSIDYYWQPIEGSNLWARGLSLGQLPSEVLLAPEIDIAGGLFAQKPAVGAFHVDKANIVPALENGNTLVVYIDADCTEPDHYGSSWATAYRSLNDAISYFAGLQIGVQVDVAGSSGSSHTISDDTQFEIRVLEGDLWPRYAFVNEDPKTATLDILAMKNDKQLKIVGGYYRNNGSSDDVRRDPLNHRSQLNGNPDGDRLEDGLYHVVTVETGAQVELDGFHVINGYAAGTASLQYGAGMLVRGNADVTLTNCIFENNTAANGAAIYAADAGHKLTMRNCVVNNNTNTNEQNQIIVANNLTLQHVTVVNNVGAAPTPMGTTSFSAGNTSGNNSLSIQTIGQDGGEANFANPTKGQGATLGFDTYLGGYASFRPLTSSEAAADHIINKGADSDLLTDIMGNERDLGGVPDLGAYEADLPKAGKVIYVRSYNQNWDTGEELDGNPSLTEGGNGSSWETAINGNVICDVDKDLDNNFYERQDNQYILSTEDNFSKGFYKFDTNFYEDFWSTSGNTETSGSNSITNSRKEQYVSGLQYAVEKAAEINASLSESEDSVEVWVGAGIYTDYKGFVIRDKVKVLGGFPKDGVPGESDRHPLISQYIPANDADKGLVKTDYETILQIRKETPVTWNGYTGTPTSIVTNLGNTVRRRYVLFQPDVCLSTWAPSNRNGGTNGRDNKYRYPGSNSDMIDNTNYQEYKGAVWDGFTVRHGYINRYYSNRDGGAGVRVFRGVTLQNMVITNNCNHHNNRNRGGGLYMDGLNSRINNSFILNNYIGMAGESMGGGAYMIVGTGYNLVVANNYSSHRGGGIFMESATFFNNTIAYNYSPNPKNGASDNSEGGSGLFQYADGNQRLSNLELYNCIFYGNYGVSISSNATGTFNDAYNCYVQGSIYTGLNGKFPSSKDNQVGQNLSNPFSVGSDAQIENNYRLIAGSSCINKGTEVVDGKILDLPSTDMDYTNRIKDCTVDIGAYERDNEDTTSPDANGVYYVTFTGFGNASADSPENAACADKLQTVLNAAGELAKQGQTAIVKVAGYADGDFVYHANTLADKDNPQSYTFVVPDGVTVMGGYFEGTFENGVYQSDGWDNARGENARNAMKFRTILSAEAVPTQGSTITQNVIGYHAVTFGGGDGTAALAKGAVIDGVWLVDGSATSMAGAGNPATMGGGAIVPDGAHVRNCVVMGNQAVQGGGLYVMPGGTVSGTAILGNTADDGGGVYAANKDADRNDVTEGSRAHIISCTIADNTADDGGGLYLEDGASMQVNTVIWGNAASANKNVSGVTNDKFTDTQLAAVFNIGTDDFYPFNDCFVESQEMPSDFENASLESDPSIYFMDDYRRLKELSPLIKHGVKEGYYDGFIATLGVAETDMQGRVRSERTADRIDAGAFAYPGGILPADLFTRIFVSPTANVKLHDGADPLDYLGQSFYTSFSTLEDALAYIRSIRENAAVTGDKSHFDIFMAGGTYKPTYQREYTNADGSTLPHDQRLYSFVIPAGVSIYGGFTGTENYAAPQLAGPVPAETGDMMVDNSFDIDAALDARDFSDFNQNNIIEPWELAGQTILSGNINVSAEVKNVYHVLYTEKSASYNDGVVGGVVLDGLTVMDGETWHDMTTVADHDAVGRGGALYSDGVAYTINRCRVLNNFGVRGGAVYMRDARLNVISSIFAGNGTVADATTPDNQPARGGAIYMAGENSADANLYAVNSLFVNNGTETTQYGGVIGTNFAEGIGTNYDPTLRIINCTFAMNRATENPVIYNHNGKSEITNTLMWGNEGRNGSVGTDVDSKIVSHSAIDRGYTYSSHLSESNVTLDTDNMASDGPRFTNPATEAGAEGNDATNLWNPAGISIATDRGDGIIPQDNGGASDAYTGWFADNGLDGYADGYIKMRNDGRTYERYSAPYKNDGTQEKRNIDIGFYEYQYVSNFSTMAEIYVDTIPRGLENGSSWANATSDLRGAIIGAANPTQNEGERNIYVRDGEYSWDWLSAGSAYLLSMGDPNNNYSSSLTIKGSCTGVRGENGEQQDFSKQTVVRNSGNASGTTLQLMTVNTNGKPVTIEGFTFINAEGDGVSASTGNGGSLTLKSCAFRGNKGSGMNVSGNSGSMLIYNTLFADGGTGLTASAGTDNITLVNTTFANNKTADMSEGLTKVYNSTSWNNVTQNNVTQNMPTGNNNKVFAAGTKNADIHSGPNFVDPDNTNIEARDYHIRPSLTLLNEGSNDNYINNVVKVNNASATDIPTEEVDLGNNARLVDKNIDIGAYEYEAPLQPIAYVKADVVGSNGDGKSWAKALSDLQGAADLVGIYAQQNKTNGYVFVHNNVKGQDVRLTLDNTKVYGGMNDETTTKENEVYPEDGTIETGNVESAVEDLLGKRAGLIERASANRSKLNDVTISGSGSVVDGFEVNGTANIDAEDGYLATSIINTSATISGTGVLYNSLVHGNVANVKAVNVTATGTVTYPDSHNNRQSAAADNTYIDTNDEWEYQLMETSADIDIDKGDNQDETGKCINAVGHNRDIAGNKRIRNTVDNGCFETWDINTGDSVITAKDYPHGKSVVYVREGKELSIADGVYAESKPFNPGVLLLEHRAGLRGNGNSVALSHVIVERNILKNSVDMAYVPYKVKEFVNDNKVAVKSYDAVKRAAYDFKFDGDNGTAWTDKTDDIYGHTGLLLDNTTGASNAKVRFIGKADGVYTESTDEVKQVTLNKNNFEDPWTVGNEGTGKRFTHKENMSWNLFGSPYLCAMKYGDMEYGRVIYGVQDGNDITRNTELDVNKNGYIPAGDAVFTQTATLYEDGETFDVERPTARTADDKAYGVIDDLTLTLTRTGETRAENDVVADELQLKAVPASEARTDFDLSADGVKWMTDSRPQIYATRGNARYSLLSAVNIEGETSVGVTVPEAGMYTIAVPDGCNTDGYETVILEDAATGRTVDLLEGGYDFTATTSGDITGRFSVSFNRMVSDGLDGGIRVYSVRQGIIRVEGVAEGDRITVFSVDGMTAARCIAASDIEDISAGVASVAVVKVERDGRTVAVRKVKVKN